MKDDQASEEKLIGELDLMYRHVAELESGQSPVEHNDAPKDHEQISDQEVQTHAKIIPFPGHRMPLLSEEPSEAPEEVTQKRKPSYRTYLIIASFSLIFLAFVFVIIPLKERMAPPGSKKGEPHQLPSALYPTPPPPVQTEQNVLQNIEERQPQAETMPQQTVQSKSASNQTIGSKSAFATAKHYTVQVGAFRNWENASERIDALRKNGLDPYWIETQSKNKRITYIVFSGYFTDRNEAAEFLKRKGIINHYPDSYVREISF